MKIIKRAYDAYIGIHTADIHFGAIEPDRLYYELSEILFITIEKMNVLHFVVISGDLLDKVLSMNSKDAKFAQKFIYELVKLASEIGFKIRIIKGTDSHDLTQLDMFSHYEDYDNVDFKIINTVKEEMLFDNLRVLYVPEEYMRDKNEYYEEYFNKDYGYYDMVFGHGMFQDVAFEKSNAVVMNKAPIFAVSDFTNICVGPILFGHIHTPYVLDESVYYSGSFTRWMQGEEEHKGFNIVCYVPETGEYLVQFMHNYLARKYVTYPMGNILRTESVENVVNSIERSISKHDIHRIRVIINNDGSDIVAPKVAILKDYFIHHENVNIIVNGDMLQIKSEEKKKEINTEYDYIFNKELNIEDKINQYIRHQFEQEIGVDRVREILFSDCIAKVDFD